MGVGVWLRQVRMKVLPSHGLKIGSGMCTWANMGQSEFSLGFMLSFQERHGNKAGRTGIGCGYLVALGRVCQKNVTLRQVELNESKKRDWVGWCHWLHSWRFTHGRHFPDIYEMSDGKDDFIGESNQNNFREETWSMALLGLQGVCNGWGFRVLAV